jgi:hypothetical protein
LLALFLLCAQAPAAVCAEERDVACGSEASVFVRFEGQGWPAELARETSDDLRAGLRVRGIALCTAADSFTTQPVATVLLHWNPFDTPLVSVEVQDELTNKRVLRDLRLANIAPDARALALAQAADELLRASWVELRLQGAPEPTREPPPVVQETVQQLSVVQSSGPALSKVLGARFAAELYGGGLRLMGADAYIAFWLAEHLGISIAIGARAAPRIHAPHGEIDASALTASAGAMLALWEREARFNLLLNLVAHVGELALTGRGHLTDVRSQSQMAFIASGRLDICSVLRVTEGVQIELGLGPGMSLRAASANDTTQVITSTRGFELHGTLGVGGRL